MKHVVQFSTGAGSAEVAYRVVEEFGPRDTVLMSADTGIEDPDNWRFASEVHAQLGCEWLRVADGRTPMGLAVEQKFIPNDRVAFCSRILKRDLLRRYLDAMFDPEGTVIYLGFDWTEEHRMVKAEPLWKPYTVAAPLMDAPYLTKHQILDRMRERGIEPPSLYADGFSHANCGGGCVRGGQAAWAHLLDKRPAEYARWEREENEVRVQIGKDVSILNDRRGGGKRRPLTLTAFREAIQAPLAPTTTGAPTLFDPDDWGACGCFMDEDESTELAGLVAGTAPEDEQ